MAEVETDVAVAGKPKKRTFNLRFESINLLAKLTIGRKMKMLGLMSTQCTMDFMVLAGISLMFGFGIFAFIASVLCSAAFFLHVKDLPA